MCFRDAEGHTPGESARAIAESQLPGAPANDGTDQSCDAYLPLLPLSTRARSHRGCLLDYSFQHRPGHGIYALKSPHEMSTLIRLGTKPAEPEPNK